MDWTLVCKYDFVDEVCHLVAVLIMYKRIFVSFVDLGDQALAVPYLQHTLPYLS